MKTSPLLQNILFLATLLLLGWIYNYYEILFQGINEPHMWRQADCLSITMNYYKDGLNFFTPQIHWTGPEGHGKTISEFPAIYFVVAKLWTVFGHHEFIFRLINLLFVFSGLFALYRLAYNYLNDLFWAFFIPLFLFTSPALVFYSNNFLMNAPSFGLALTALHFYTKWHRQKQRKWLVVSMLLFLLAGLLKITSLMIFMALLSLLAFQSVQAILKKETSLKKIGLQLMPFVLVMLGVFSWYTYARHYCHENIQGIFLQGLYPIWEVSAAQRSEILHQFYRQVLPSVFNRKGLAVCLALFIWILLSFKKVKPEFYFLVVITLLGELLFLSFWFQAINIHDYYLINLLVIVPLITFTFLHTLKHKHPAFFQNKLIKLLALLGLLLLVYQASLLTRIKYNPADPWLKANIFIGEKEQERWERKYRNYQSSFQALEEINPYLRSLGIERDERVVSIPDPSINISLYLIDQKGFTDFGYSETKGKITERMNRFIQIGADYLIVNREESIKADAFGPYTQEQIGEFKQVKIYKLPEPKNE